jgi:hypothetical protein
MKVIKIAATVASCFLIALFFLIIIVENPEVALYNETVEMLMNQEKLETEDEVLDHFPALKDIKSMMNRISYLKSSIHSITGGPAPNVSKEESLYVQRCAHEIRQLQRNIKEELSQLIIIYATVEP